MLSWAEGLGKYILSGTVFALVLVALLARPPGTVADHGGYEVGDALAVGDWAFLISEMELLDHSTHLQGLQVVLNGRQLTRQQVESCLPILKTRLDGLALPYSLQVDNYNQIKIDLPLLEQEERERLLKILGTTGRLRLINKYNQELLTGERLIKATARMAEHQPVILVEFTQADCNLIAGSVKPYADIRDNPWVYIDSGSITALTPGQVDANSRELILQGFKSLDNARDMALILNSGILPHVLPAAVYENSLSSFLKTKEGILVVHWEAHKRFPEADSFQLPPLVLKGPGGETQPEEPWVLMVQPRYREAGAREETGDATGGYLAWRVSNRQGPWLLCLPDGRVIKLTRE